MKVRKLAVALALAGTMGSNLAYALGLGDAEIKSNLNEPLRAEIELVGVGDMTGEEVIANLAPERDFRKIGIEPIFFLNEIQFKVVKNGRGELVLQLTTKKPVREPYLNFLVEVAWPSGRLLREYALLIDPPVFRDGITAQPIQVAATPPAPTRQEPKTLPSSAARTSPPAGSVAPSRTETPVTTARVSSSDTLWSIAVQVRPADDLTPQQVMLALQDANPEAFIRNNINLVREGSILRIPSEEAIRSRTRREAVQQVNAQNRLFRQPDQGSQVAAIEGAKPRTSAAAASTASAEAGDELRLLAGDSVRAEDGSHGGDMGGSGSGTAETRLALSLEELDQSRRENEELNSRLDDLHEQLASMQRLLELKNDRLAAMQAEREAQAEADTDTGLASSAVGQIAEGDAEVRGQTTDAIMAVSPDAAVGAEESAEDGAATVQQQVADSSAVIAPNAEVGEGQEVRKSADSPVVERAEKDQLDIFATAAEAAGSEVTGNLPMPANEELSPVAGTVAQAVEPVPVATVDDAASIGTLQQLMGNPLYQTVAGATGATGVAVLALLGFLARRRTRREEEEFYAQVHHEEEGEEKATGSDAFATSLHAAGVPAVEDFENDIVDGGFDQETPAQGELNEQDDPAAEADRHLAYGGFSEAARVLEDAVSLAPERGDLRLKLLEVYAAAGNEDAFAMQMAEFEAVNDDAVARAQAESLREQLTTSPDQAEQDDLDTLWGVDGAVGTASSAEDEGKATDFDFDLGLNDNSATVGATRAADGEDEGDLEFSLDESEFEAGLADDGDSGMDLSDAELDALDLDEALESNLALAAAGSTMPKADLSGFGNAAVAEAKAELPQNSHLNSHLVAEIDAGFGFDESFLEELDAELDKVAGEESAVSGDTALGELQLDDLELDRSEEALAAGGFPESDLEFDGSEVLAAEIDEVPTVDDRALDDVEDEIAAAPSLDENGSPAQADRSHDFDDSLLEEDGKAVDDLGDGDLDDDFDFLEDIDEAGTKLDLARAYVEMGDAEGAREILAEVSLEGTDVQKQEARGLLEQLS